MLADSILNALIDLATTLLVIAALVITCAAMTPPRPLRGPHP